MQFGQSPLEEIIATMRAEGPFNLFYFNGQGEPTYLGWEWKAASPYNAVQATFGDGAAEIGYQDIRLIYDNEVFNTIDGSREGGERQNVLNQASIDSRKPKARSEEVDLPLTDDNNVLSVIDSVRAFYGEPTMRPASLTVNSAKALTQILALDIGSRIRVRRLSNDATPIDRVTHIIGKSKAIDVNRHVTCTWNLARGFDAGAGVWRAGVAGFSEAGSTTVAG